MAFEWNIFVLQNPRSERERERQQPNKTGLFAVIYSLKKSCAIHNFWDLEKANIYICVQAVESIYILLFGWCYLTQRRQIWKKFEISLSAKTGSYYLKFAHTICIKQTRLKSAKTICKCQMNNWRKMQPLKNFKKINFLRNFKERSDTQLWRTKISFNIQKLSKRLHIKKFISQKLKEKKH